MNDTASLDSALPELNADTDDFRYISSGNWQLDIDSFTITLDHWAKFTVYSIYYNGRILHADKRSSLALAKVSALRTVAEMIRIASNEKE